MFLRNIYLKLHFRLPVTTISMNEVHQVKELRLLNQKRRLTRLHEFVPQATSRTLSIADAMSVNRFLKLYCGFCCSERPKLGGEVLESPPSS